jgi:hypothetical protein
MKKLIIIFIGFLVIAFAGCQKIQLPWSKKSSPQTNDLFSENIREDFSSTNTNNELVGTNENMTESVKPGYNTNLMPLINEKTQLTVEPEVGEKVNTNVINESQSNTTVRSTELKKEKTVAVNAVKKARFKNKVKKEKNIKEVFIETEQLKSGLIILIGSGAINQNAAPRKSIKMTFVAVTKSREYKYCDFIIYAIPIGKGKILDSDHIIGEVDNIDFVNGQAQYTKFWNGKNIDDDFLLQDDYNIFAVCKLKNTKYEVLKKEGRYWGMADKYYISLK